MLEKDVLRAVNFKRGYSTYFKQDFINNGRFFLIDGMFNGKSHSFLCKVTKKDGFKHLKVVQTEDYIPEIMLEFIISSTAMYHTVYIVGDNHINEYKFSIKSIKDTLLGGKND